MVKQKLISKLLTILMVFNLTFSPVAFSNNDFDILSFLPAILTAKKNTKILVAQADNVNNPYVLLATDKEGKESIGLSAIRDDSGNILKLHGITHVNHAENTGTLFEFGDNGLISKYSNSAGYSATFINYTSNTVDVSVFDEHGILVAGPTTESIDAEILNGISQLYAAYQTSDQVRLQSIAGSKFSIEEILFQLKVMSLTVSVFSCSLTVIL